MDAKELQRGLNEVVANKVRRMIEAHQSRVSETVQRLAHEHEIAQDFLVPVGNIAGPSRMGFYNGERIQIYIPHQGAFNLHNNALSQLGEKMGIPPKYLRELSDGSPWQRQLAVTILNEHGSQIERNRYLVRAVGNEVRGVLSDSYRRLNSQLMLAKFIERAVRHGAVMCDAYMSDTKVWAETIIPQPICIPTRQNGDVIIYMGARFSTSDYGDGAVDVRAFLLNGVCLNGMVRETVMKKIHLGARLGDNMALSQRTYELDTQTNVSAISDITDSLFKPENQHRTALEIQRASEITVNFEKELAQLIKGKLLKDESEEVQKLLMVNNPEDGLTGGPTLWKLTQAITAHARNLEPVRCRELHEIAGELMQRAAA